MVPGWGPSVQTHELMGRGDISLLNPSRIFYITEFYLEVFMYSSTSPLSDMFYNFCLPVCGLIFFFCFHKCLSM